MDKRLKTFSVVLLAVGFGVAALVLVIRPSSPGPPSPPNILLNAAGATFPYPIYSKWFDVYHKLHPEVEINYQSIGSGGGIQQLKAGTVDFGASDMPLNDKLLATFSFKIMQFPTVLGAVLPTYNVPGFKGTLNFTPQALAGIYLGQITKWNDPAITKPNPGISLPNQSIVVVHRSDGSGTTFVWTDFLSKVSPEWKSRVGSNTSVNWPIGLGGKGNEGVSGIVSQTPYSIGYVELIYALETHLLYGTVQNTTGRFVKASLETVTEAAAGAAAKMQSDVRISITNAPGANAYPVCSFTYLLIPSHIADATKRGIIKGFLHWMLTDGQQYAAPLAYASLPKPVVAIEMKHIWEIN
ncbi:MAG: phosphate ABC transporter substrate-binding protein PstS [Terriglobia bacterium]